MRMPQCGALAGGCKPSMNGDSPAPPWWYTRASNWSASGAVERFGALGCAQELLDPHREIPYPVLCAAISRLDGPRTSSEAIPSKSQARASDNRSGAFFVAGHLRLGGYRAEDDENRRRYTSNARRHDVERYSLHDPYSRWPLPMGAFPVRPGNRDITPGMVVRRLRDLAPRRRWWGRRDTAIRSGPTKAINLPKFPVALLYACVCGDPSATVSQEMSAGGGSTRDALATVGAGTREPVRQVRVLGHEAFVATWGAAGRTVGSGTGVPPASRSAAAPAGRASTPPTPSWQGVPGRSIRRPAHHSIQRASRLLVEMVCAWLDPALREVTALAVPRCIARGARRRSSRSVRWQQPMPTIRHSTRNPRNGDRCRGSTWIRAGDRTRTGDVQLGKLAFYQLNYAREALPN
jgi:hypothetical protein